jgi:hypothetical protein
VTHWMSYYDESAYLKSVDLKGKDVTVEIEKVEGATVTGEGGKTSKKPLLYFKGAKKPHICSKTDSKTLASMFGPNVEDWIGKRVTLYGTTTRGINGDTVDCIRVRPVAPK